MIQDRRMRLPLLQFVGCALGLLAVRYFFPHYAAPLTVTLILLLIQAMRHLRRWEVKGRPIGIFLTRAILALQLLRVALQCRPAPSVRVIVRPPGATDT